MNSNKMKGLPMFREGLTHLEGKELLDREHLDRYVIGHSIVEVREEGRSHLLVLDDGITLEIKDQEECCAYWRAVMTSHDLDSNIITDVRVKADGHDGNKMTIHLVSIDKDVVDIAVDGDPGSGYYCQSVWMDVWVPPQQMPAMQVKHAIRSRWSMKVTVGSDNGCFTGGIALGWNSSPTWTCPHRHRTWEAAERCAKKSLVQFRKEAGH